MSLGAITLPKKLPNPVDKYVGMRVRMRRIMMEMSQEKLGDALGLTFQQVQKYEKGTNRIGASRLHKIAGILEVPVAFFFEGCPGTLQGSGRGPQETTPEFMSEFLASTDGISLTKAFVSIDDKKLRRSIVELVEQIAAGRDRA